MLQIIQLAAKMFLSLSVGAVVCVSIVTVCPSQKQHNINAVIYSIYLCCPYDFSPAWLR